MGDKRNKAFFGGSRVLRFNFREIWFMACELLDYDELRLKIKISIDKERKFFVDLYWEKNTFF